MYGHGAPKSPQFAAASFICAVLVLVPVATHWRARNVATLAMMLWLFVVNITRFLNALVWANNADIRWVVYCDITTKITIGSIVALPACMLCICRWLERVAAVRVNKVTASDERRRMIFEGCMCFLLPCVFMAIHYISQGHRFDIVQEMGCAPTVYLTWVSILTVYSPPIVLSAIGFVYAGLAIHHLRKHHIDLQMHLKNSRLTASVYRRLMLLALTEMLCAITIHSYILYCNVTAARGGVHPWINWEDTHWGFSRIQVVARILVPAEWWARTVAFWWMIPVASFLFFAFFATGREAMQDYQRGWNWIQRKIFRRDIPSFDDDDYDARVRAARRSFRGTNFNSSGTGVDSSQGSRETKLPSLDMGILEKGHDSDRESFVSADGKDTKHSPYLSTPTTAAGSLSSPLFKKGESYLEQDLDTSVFDRISISDSVIEAPPRVLTRSNSQRSGHGAHLGVRPDSPTTPRSIRGNVTTNQVPNDTV